jgi:predicted metal-binding membrane protein
MDAVPGTDTSNLIEPVPVYTRILAHWPWLLVLAAWAIALLATWSHQSYLFNHDYLIQESGLPWIAALIFFLVCWQVMIAAMMLPSSLLLISRPARVVRPQPHQHAIITAFLAGYALIWTGFAALAFLGDTGIHLLVNHWFWLARHPWVIGAVTFAIAGFFQFSPFKRRSLQACRDSFQRFTLPTGAEIRDAWRQGRHHGRCCLGSCWALMLLMFGVGVGSLAWMAVLTAVMLIEKVMPGGRWLSPVVGVAALLLAALWLAHPADVLLTIAG